MALQGPHSLLRNPNTIEQLREITGRPTGQGFYGARKSDNVKGPIEAQVKEEPKEYKTQGE